MNKIFCLLGLLRFESSLKLLSIELKMILKIWLNKHEKKVKNRKLIVELQVGPIINCKIVMHLEDLILLVVSI